MKLRMLSESASEEAVLRVFSRLVTSVNNVAELLEKVSGEEDQGVAKQLEEEALILGSTAKRIETLGITPQLWSSLKQGISSAEIGNSWTEFRTAIVRNYIPDILTSLGALTEGSIENLDAKLAIAKQRVQSLQEIITGSAPTSSPDVTPEEGEEALGDIEAGAEPEPEEETPQGEEALDLDDSENQ